MHRTTVSFLDLNDAILLYGNVVCCSVVCGTLVGVSVFSIMCFELLIMLEIS